MHSITPVLGGGGSRGYGIAGVLPQSHEMEGDRGHPAFSSVLPMFPVHGCSPMCTHLHIHTVSILIILFSKSSPG